MEDKKRIGFIEGKWWRFNNFKDMKIKWGEYFSISIYIKINGSEAMDKIYDKYKGQKYTENPMWTPSFRIRYFNPEE